MTDASPSAATLLANRALLRISGDDARGFLNGLVTNDVLGALPCWAGLLTAQGKALFDFIIWADGDDLVVDCERAAADELVRRLCLYRLRRAIGIVRDDALAVHWARDAAGAGPGAVADPRLAALGWRWLAPASDGGAAADPHWTAHRLMLGVAEGRAELGSDKILWLETNAAELAGVSFTKGCYVGQENTARMNWRQKVNRRLVVVPMAAADPARQMAAYPDLGWSVEHRRVEAIDRDAAPAWLARGLAGGLVAGAAD